MMPFHHAPWAARARLGDAAEFVPAKVTMALRIAAAACAMALASRVQVPFWGTPVPFTFGPQMALLLAAVLGPRESTAALVAWLTAGAMGAPVFASNLVGVQAFVGPTAGYMLGYLPAAAVVGRYGQRNTFAGAMAWLAGTAVILAAGAVGVGALYGWLLMWPVALAPFILADMCKAALVFAGLHGAGRTIRAFLR